MSEAWATLRWFVALWISRAGVLVGRFLPVRPVYWLANPFADVCYRIMTRHRQGLLANLAPVVGEEQAEAAARRVFRNFARYVIDFYQIPARGKEALCRRIDFHQWRALDDALDSGNGTIFVTLHLGQAELGAGALTAYDHPVNVIAEPLTYGPMNEFIQDLRRRLGMTIIPAKSAKPGVLRCLNRGEVLGLMFDAVEPGEGLMVDFFGRAAEFSGTPARIAARTGARVLPAVVARDPQDPTRLLPIIDFDLDFEPSGDADEDARSLTQAIAASFEKMVQRFPDQWFAFRPVWRETSAAMNQEHGTRLWMQWSLRLAAKTGAYLPRPVSYLMARLGGDLAFRFRHATRADVEDNLRHVLGPTASEHKVTRQSREVFRNVARYYVDLIRLPQTTPQQLIERDVHITGLEKILEATAQGRGVVVATAHFGNPEIGVQAGAVLGLNLMVLAEPLNPPSFSRLMKHLRTFYGARYEDVSFRTVAAAIDHLKHGGVLAITCDRDIQGAGVPLEFFGQVTRLPLGAVEFASRTGAALIPGFTQRRGSSFEVVFEDEVPLVKTDHAKQDALTNAETLLRRAEEWIRRDPGQWMVLERIWRPVDQHDEPAEAAAIIKTPLTAQPESPVTDGHHDESQEPARAGVE